MGGEAFDSIIGSVDPPLVVVTTAAQGERGGCVVGFHAQSGIAPERYCLWLSKANHTYRVGLRATTFAVHFLTADDLPLAELFGGHSGEELDKFARTAWTAGPDGVPLLEDLPHRLELRRVALLDEGSDHVCVTTEVVAAHSTGRFEPLRLSAAAHVQPGHDAQERAPL